MTHVESKGAFSAAPEPNLVEKARRISDGGGVPSLSFIGRLADRIEALERTLRHIADIEPADKYWAGRVARAALKPSHD